LSDPATLPAALRLFPQCEREIHAFVDLTRLADAYGDDWPVFQDAIDDVWQQVLDCADPGVAVADRTRRGVGARRPAFWRN
jgi:hypothetical protein